MTEALHVSAVVLAAGASRRMGQSKMLLPWGQSSVIRKVLETLLEAGVEQPVVVTGRTSQEIHLALAGLPIRWEHNSDYEHTEMLQSLQIGLQQLPQFCDAFLVALGDQPQIEPRIVRQILDQAATSTANLIIPSFQLRRGHPWLVRKALWGDLAALDSTATLRQFLNDHAGQIEYLNVDSDSVLMDLDTPEDYARFQSKRIS